MLDTLIIGNGLAGSFLAWSLTQHGHSVRLLAPDNRDSASTIAAGLMQVVSGKYLTLNAFNESCLHASVAHYKTLEQQWDCALITELPTRRVLPKIKINKWLNKKKRPEYQRYFIDDNLDSDSPSITLSGTYCVNPGPLFSGFKRYFKEKDMFIDAVFDEQKLHVFSDHVCYDGLDAKCIIFCCGHASRDLSFFSHLPFESVKGETLLFDSDTGARDHVYQDEYWVVPRNNKRFITGATYDPDCSFLPTKSGQARLIDSLDGLDYGPITPVQACMGIRSFVPDMLPVFGWHKETACIGIFSGLGSKGFATAPVLAHQWAGNFPELPTGFVHCDVNRFHLSSSAPSLTEGV